MCVCVYIYIHMHIGNCQTSNVCRCVYTMFVEKGVMSRSVLGNNRW